MDKGIIDILLITEGDFSNKAMTTSIDKLLKILLSETSNIHLVTFCDKNNISSISKENIFSLRIDGNRFTRFLLSQFLIAKTILSIHQTANIQTVIFAFGLDLQIIPIIIAKRICKKMIIRSDGRPTKMLAKYFKSRSLTKRYFFKAIEEINYRLADIVLTECEYMISENDFGKYNAQNGALFVDTYNFTDKICLRNRQYEIGFVGRLARDKGILNFLEALQLLNRNYNLEAKGIIIGDGAERNEVLRYVHLIKPRIIIEYPGWVENANLPDYLNEIKVLIAPTYLEGTPNRVLEAMSCGTPVLATAVGGIPGVIRDGETGFIMENNSPECIAENMVRALNHPDLEQIAMNARALIEKEYTYEASVERYRKILTD